MRTSTKPGIQFKTIEALKPEPLSPTEPIKLSQRNFRRGLALADKLYGFQRPPPSKEVLPALEPKPIASSHSPERLRKAFRRSTIRKGSFTQLQTIGSVLQDLLQKTRAKNRKDSDGATGRNAKVIELLNYQAERMHRTANSPRKSKDQLSRSPRTPTYVNYQTNQVRSKSSDRFPHHSHRETIRISPLPRKQKLEPYTLEVLRSSKVPNVGLYN